MKLNAHLVLCGVVLSIAACGPGTGNKPPSAKQAALVLPATLEGELNIANSEGDGENIEWNFGDLVVGETQYSVQIDESVLVNAGLAHADYDKGFPVRAVLTSKEDGVYIVTALEKR
jgi:hypothetical protein